MTGAGAGPAEVPSPGAVARRRDPVSAALLLLAILAVAARQWVEVVLVNAASPADERTALAALAGSWALTIGLLAWLGGRLHADGALVWTLAGCAVGAGWSHPLTLMVTIQLLTFTLFHRSLHAPLDRPQGLEPAAGRAFALRLTALALVLTLLGALAAGLQLRALGAALDPVALLAIADHMTVPRILVLAPALAVAAVGTVGLLVALGRFALAVARHDPRGRPGAAVDAALVGWVVACFLSAGPLPALVLLVARPVPWLR